MMSMIASPLHYSTVAVTVGLALVALAAVLLAFWAVTRRRSLAAPAMLLPLLGAALIVSGISRPLAAKSDLSKGRHDAQRKPAAAKDLSIGQGDAQPESTGLQEIRQELKALRQTQAETLVTLKLVQRVEAEKLKMEILNQPKYQDPKRLNRYESKVFSQFGEDGIITEIFRRIGTTNRFFVEFGSASGFEGNTTLLLRQGWGGLWMDGNHDSVQVARAHFAPEVESKKLNVVETFITAENIEELFGKGNVPEELDFLSIDIDRNDYYVWEKITHYRPRVVCIEYNPVYVPPHKWVIPYDPKGWWDNTSKTGASLQALEELGKAKGYCLVGCSLGGVNAFFVRQDLVGDHFAGPFTAENHYEPLRIQLYEMYQSFTRVP